jgi:hypothetical protein
MDFGWNESASRVHPRYDVGGILVKPQWKLGGVISVINISLLR